MVARTFLPLTIHLVAPMLAKTLQIIIEGIRSWSTKDSRLVIYVMVSLGSSSRAQTFATDSDKNNGKDNNIDNPADHDDEDSRFTITSYDHDDRNGHIDKEEEEKEGENFLEG